uniref:Demeter RRM-fold domain-containing protein n=2 Tax=Opuntia streptacantha TaxID=393608 RepID=A0A7C8Z2T6_OPUST
MEESNKHSVSLDDDVQDESLTVPGTLLVFADDESSQRPIDVPRIWLWNLPRRTLYCGSGITSIFRGLTWREIHRCCCEGFVCTRGFNRKTRAPKKLHSRLHVKTTKLQEDED